MSFSLQMKCISKDDKIRTEGARSSPFSWKKNCRINSIIIIEAPGRKLVLLAITARESFLQDEKDIRGFSFFFASLSLNFSSAAATDGIPSPLGWKNYSCCRRKLRKIDELFFFTSFRMMNSTLWC